MDIFRPWPICSDPPNILKQHMKWTVITMLKKGILLTLWQMINTVCSCFQSSNILMIKWNNTVDKTGEDHTYFSEIETSSHTNSKWQCLVVIICLQLVACWCSTVEMILYLLLTALQCLLLKHQQDCHHHHHLWMANICLPCFSIHYSSYSKIV